MDTEQDLYSNMSELENDDIGDVQPVAEELVDYHSAKEAEKEEAEPSSNSEAARLKSEEEKEIKQEVQKAIDNILKNPDQITNIVNSLKGNKNVLRQVLDFLQKNPQLKNEAMYKAMRTTPTMQEISRMPKKQRDEIIRKAKEARKELAALNPTDHKAVLINISKVAKNYPISAEFPSGSKYCDGIVEELKHGLHYVYLPEEKRINKRATQVVGRPTYGEIVIFRLDENEENILDFTLEEFNELFPKSDVRASAARTPVAKKSHGRRK